MVELAGRGIGQRSLAEGAGHAVQLEMLELVEGRLRYGGGLQDGRTGSPRMLA